MTARRRERAARAGRALFLRLLVRIRLPRVSRSADRAVEHGRVAVSALRRSHSGRESTFPSEEGRPRPRNEREPRLICSTLCESWRAPRQGRRTRMPRTIEPAVSLARAVGPFERDCFSRSSPSPRSPHDPLVDAPLRPDAPPRPRASLNTRAKLGAAPDRRPPAVTASSPTASSRRRWTTWSTPVPSGPRARTT